MKTRAMSIYLSDRDRQWLQRDGGQISTQLRHDLALLRMLIDDSRDHPEGVVGQTILAFDRVYSETR